MNWKIPLDEQKAQEMRAALEREHKLRELLAERERRRILVRTEIRALRGQ